VHFYKFIIGDFKKMVHQQLHQQVQVHNDGKKSEKD